MDRKLARLMIRILPPFLLALLGAKAGAWLIANAGLAEAALRCLNR